MNKPKIQISWSGGKDSALALHEIIKSGKYEIVGIHTVVEDDTKRVGIHNLKEEFIEAQAERIGLPLTKLYLPKKPMAYEKLMKEYYTQLKADNIDYVMFGDIFLEDLKDFREQILKSTGTKGIYPLWNKNSRELVDLFFKLGFQTKLCAVNAKFFTLDFVGEYLSNELLDVHPTIDPCGENGEYHSFVIDGPIFSKPLHLIVDSKYEREFVFKVKNKKGKVDQLKDKFYFAEFELITQSKFKDSS